ncbi:MAG: lamin tail domain-containing protein [Planctomycetota bacterium]|jgi:hypothetical protein
MFKTSKILLLLLICFAFLACAVATEPYLIGDLNKDHRVDFADLQALATLWLDESCLIVPCDEDLNAAGGVNMADFTLLARTWGMEQTFVVISEFMAKNDTTLADEEGKFRDWIEIYNPSGTSVSLDGWYLTDNMSNLTKWAFPAGVELGPGEFLVVFASGKDRRNPNNFLHTSFKLDGSGGDLALVAPDGFTVAHKYEQYPDQLTDVSYGLSQYARTLVGSGATVSYYVSTADDAASDWTALDFSDSSWDTGPTGLGFGFGGVPRRAYNDCVYEGNQYIGQNVTTYGIGSGFVGETSGPLIDQSTGQDIGITVTLTEDGGVNWQPDPGNAGSDCATGTDAYNTFNGMADMTGVIYYGNVGWWIDLTFTGLDPSTEYTFATSASRNNYTNRLTIYTISGADSYTNASTPGVDVLTASENKVRFNTGDNHNEGYVARWTGIRASDGTFKVRAESDPSSTEGRKAYSFDVFMLEGGFGGSDIQTQMQNKNSSVWMRAEFDLEEGEQDIFEKLTLRMKYEDGFVAYLNGQEVARRNAPTTVNWNSAAKSDRSIESASVFESINIMAHKNALRNDRNVLAIHGLNDDKVDDEFLILPELIAASGAGIPQYCTTATPGSFNVPGAKGRVSNVWFSHERDFYNTAFQLILSTEMSNAVIRYTLDGTRPSATNGSVYSSPIPISKTSAVRAVAVRPGYIDSNVETHTYIFVNDVINQSPNGQAPGPGWPTGSVNGQVIDYGMDRDVTYNQNYKYVVDDALLAVPTISLVTDLANLFDSSRGIYVNAGSSGRSWERPSSVELINPDGSDGFQIDAGLRIRGGYSRGSWNPKHAFRLFFRAEYGQAKLEYPLFGDEGADEFDCVDLRTSQNYSWAHGGGGGRHNTLVREVFSRDLQGEMGHPYTRSRYYHLYINGVYWGLFQTQERSEASYAESYLDGDKDDFDVVKTPGMNPTDGNRDALDRLYYETIAGLDNSERYYRVQGLNIDGTRNPDYERLLDVDNVIDFMIIEYYTGDRDGPASRYTNVPNNTYGIFNRVNPDGWKWFHHDNEHSLGAGSAELNMVTPFSTAGAQRQAFNPHWLHEQLANNNMDYRLRFADHVYASFFNNGLLTTGKARARIQNRANQINMAIIAESARWGDGSTHPARTKDNDWSPEIYRLLYDTSDKRHLTPRVATVLDQFKSVGWYPNVQPPTLSRYGGFVNSGLILHIVAQTGTVYYTLDESDPRVSVAQSAPGDLVTLVTEGATKKVLVPTSPVSGSTGSILQEYWTGISGTAVSALTSSPDYPGNPSGTDLLTRFEVPVDWADYYGTRVRGYLHPPATGSYTFWMASDDNGELWLSTDENPANKVMIANVPGWTSSREWTRYSEQRSAPVSLVAGRKYYIEGLMKEEGGGDNLAVTWQGPGASYGSPIPGNYLSPAGDTWATTYYSDTGWPSGSGGVGYEKQTGYEDLIGFNVESLVYGKNTTCYIRVPFVTNHTDFRNLTLKIRYDDGFIAYLNGAEVARRNFSGAPQWNSQATSSHPDSSAVIFEEIDISSHINVLRQGDNVLGIHGLNTSSGDVDFLISAELAAYEIGQGDVSQTAIEYSAPITLTHSTRVKARVLDGQWSPLADAVFAIGPVKENLRITEIMYHPYDAFDPNDPNEEFVELTNIGAETINLNLVKFTNGIDFTFGDIDLLPGKQIVVVQDRTAFEAKYGTNIDMAGEFSGRLDNSGERIRLEDAIGQTILDFRYNDTWRRITDGQGFSLTIVDPTNPDLNSWALKDSWRASAYSGGSPGDDDSGIAPNPGELVINEVLAHSHGANPDWIELHNTTGQTIDIGGWFLSDNGVNTTKYEIADGTVIGPYGYKVFYEDVHFNNLSNPGCHEAFALSENGDEVYLTSADEGVFLGFRQSEDFGASETGVSFGRYYKASTNNYNFVAMDHVTPGSANAYPKVGPIVFTEIMYNPQYGNQSEEYIELCNISSSPVALYRYDKSEPWKFTDGIDFTFPANTPVEIAAGGYLLVVKDPDAFIAKYGTIPAGIQVLGPYGGKLSNGGERLEISMPGDVDLQTCRECVNTYASKG